MASSELENVYLGVRWISKINRRLQGIKLEAAEYLLGWYDKKTDNHSECEVTNRIQSKKAFAEKR